MKRRKMIQGALSAVLLQQAVCRSALAQNKDALQMLKNFVKNSKRAEGAFSQTMIGKDGKVLDGPLTGIFAFERPGRFVWEVIKPYPQKIVSDAKDIYIWDPDLNQVTVKRLTSAVSSTPASILFGTGDIEKSFRLENLPAADNLYWVRATPLVEDLTYSTIDLGFNDQGLIAAMTLKDHFGQTTELKLSAVAINGNVPRERFQFTIPEGADVLRDDNQ